MSPDPSGLYYADPTNPQSLNLYSYVLNNPLKYIDPTGMECVWDDGSFDSADDKQTGSHAGCSAAGGTYADPQAFSQLHAGDWSNQANSNLANVATALNSSSTDVTVNANGSGSVDETGYNLSSFGLTLSKNNYSWNGDASLALATGVTKHTNCAMGAFRRNAVAMGLDGVGLVPGAGETKLVTDVASATVQAANSAMQGDVTGAGLSGGDLVTKPIIAAVKRDGARAIPAAGEIYSGFLLARDVWNASGEVARCF